MKISATKVLNTLTGKSRRRRRATNQYWTDLRTLIQTDQNKAEGIFDEDWYQAVYPDVRDDNFDPLKHYVLHGSGEDRKPGPNFDGAFYRSYYPDVSGADMEPLIHYLRHGRAEGRTPNPHVLPGSPTPAGRSKIRHVIVKEMKLAPGAEAALMVTHTGSGRLKPHVLPYIEQLRGAGLAVMLVVIVDRPLELLEEEIAAADGIVVRDNGGYDFGAWAHGFQLCPALFGAGLLVMTNDSVVATADSTIFRAMIDRVRASPADITGLTASHEYGWHLQSYFLAFKPKALSSWGFQHFIRDIRRIDDKDEVIRTYEVPFAGRMQAAGLTVRALYAAPYAANATFFSWRELIEQGFPFIKLLYLRKQFAHDTDQHAVLDELQKSWPKVLEKAGFDVDLVHASVRAADLTALPRGNDTNLLVDADRYEPIKDDHPLRIAYFGPWNYENGLGAASREMLCALRHTGAQINAHPVLKPFHIHRLICPAVETIDFNARPDVAIVHLNPDSWNVLTAEQLEIIRSAKRRIGYWVWETDRLPPTWQENLNAVDRVWAPSTYCADVFADAMKVPVDVVPHPVRVPAEIPTDRDSVLRRFGIDPQQRVILYIFDGASYLVRKNPDGLIRAFANSGLAERGWTLVLKTKHLQDRPEAGRALTALANDTPGVRILEVSLHADEVTSLMAAADIYASPHSSEGFGLTVAEAMAVGKPVVATDFAGTRDFVDASCGYPVTAKPWTLTESHGHYLAGHSWAKVDETALAKALVVAAERVDSGDRTINQAARANIARKLSYDAVAQAITTSIDALIARKGEARPAVRRPRIIDLPPVPQHAINLSGAQRFDQLVRDRKVVPVALGDDLSCLTDALPDGDDGDWLLFAPGSAHVAPLAVDWIIEATNNRPDITLLYADDVAAGEDMLDRVRLKPDYNQTLLVAQDYIGAPVAVRRKALMDAGGLNPARGTAALYDMVLRVAEAGGAIGRLPRVLIGYEGRRPMPGLEDRRATLKALRSLANVEIADGAAPGLLVQRRRFEEGSHPAVSLVIPTRRTRHPTSDRTYVENLLAGIAQAKWPMDRLTVVVGDDVPGEPETWSDGKWPFRLRRIETLRGADEPFNYAAKMNRLWRASEDEHIVFMNDDVTPTNPGWLAALIGFTRDNSVGGVGGRLYYEDGSLQHAGIFPTMRTVAHAWLGWPVEAPTYQDWAVAQREWSMVTGAVFAVRRSLLQQINGFDERFSLEFNDIDLCLRIRNLGYRVVYNPEAEFIHAEKASRGDSIPPGAEVALFLSRWSNWLAQDPASHPGYIANRLDVVAQSQPDAWYSR